MHEDPTGDRDDDAEEDRREAVVAADDTGLISQQTLLTEVELGDDEPL